MPSHFYTLAIADLLRVLEDVVSGRRSVIERFDDEDYYEKDDYHQKMNSLTLALVDAGLANNTSEATNLFVDIRNEIRQQHGIPPK